MRTFIIILICLHVSTMIFGNVEKNETTFVPTREWQVVKKGTPIPKGLHVRHNFETGITEAKLLDSDEMEENDSKAISSDSQSKSLTLHPEEAVAQSDNNEQSEVTEKPDRINITVEELMVRLTKIKDEAEGMPELEDKKMNQMFRDYETLKKELKSLDVNITTDSELLTSYIQKFQSHKDGITMGTLSNLDLKDVLDILYNLEYLLHHIDNAKVFTDMQGMTEVILPCLNGTYNEVKEEALLLFGAAVQNNPKVQRKALDNDFVHRILYLLSNNKKPDIASRCLYALSALLRQFPMAQKAWMDQGGLTLFGHLLINYPLQIQIKIMKLVNDLIIERQNLPKILLAEKQETKLSDVADINVHIVLEQYCVHLSDLMTDSFTRELDNKLGTDNYEFIEVISESMIVITPICETYFREKKDSLLPVIKHLFDFYQNSNLNDDRTENEMLNSLASLTDKLHKMISEIPHDEL